MLTKPISLSIVVPALNEENNLTDTIRGITKTLYDADIDWEVILVNDGSSDGTADIANGLADGESRIKVIHHHHPMGIGCCFRDGVKISTKDAVTWFPADGENDPNELIKYLPLLEHVDIIIPFVLNVGMRSWGRRILSTLYLWIINLSFGTMFNYTNGNVIYRRTVFEIVKPKSNGFFFQTECLIKAVRSGFIFAEVPVRLRRRSSGRSKAISVKSFCSVLIDFLYLFIEIHILKRA
jgi:glycosyltransferase involved in cell wall biosynthesis